MKKALVVLFLIAMLVAMATVTALSLRDEGAVASSGAQPWPGEMGTLDSVLARYPPLQANDASVKLSALGKALAESKEVDDFVRREVSRGELAIGEPPALPEVSAIRELLLREPIVWERHGGIGDAETDAMRGMLMRMARALAASALARGRANDPAAWEDLHAAWNLASSLDGNPQMMVQTAVLSIARVINAVAWKMPLPSPPWLGELLERDGVGPLLESFQYQTACYWQDGARMFPTKWLAKSVEHDRQIAEDLFRATTCEVSPPMNEVGTDLTPFWRRAFRYRAEREATANALRLREGKSIDPASRCSDGGWSFDGTTLRFSRELSTPASDAAMPLVLRLKP